MIKVPMDERLSPRFTHIRPIEVATTAPFLFRLSLDENDGRRTPSRVSAETAAGAAAPPGPAFLSPASLRVIKPLLLQEMDDELIILDGHRRMHVAYGAGLDRIPALIYPKTAPARAICDLVLSSALESSGASGVEKVLAAFKISRFMAHGPFRGTLPVAADDIPRVPPELVPPFGSIFGRTVSEHWLLRAFRILTAGLPELRAMHSLRLPVDHCVPLLDLDGSERTWLVHQKETTAMSAAEMRSIARLLIFARAKPGFSLDRLSTGREDALPGSIDGASLIGLLRREIYPELCARERAIASCVKSMDLPPGISIRPPENLEGNSFSCYFTFSSSLEFRRYMNVLRWAGGDGKITAMLKELNRSAEHEE
jgi:hypothetical protein